MITRFCVRCSIAAVFLLVHKTAHIYVYKIVLSTAYVVPIFRKLGYVFTLKLHELVVTNAQSCNLPRFHVPF